MSAAPRGAARPRGRPVKGDEPAPTSDIMLAAAEAFSLHGYNGISLRTLNDQLGVSHNLLYNRFGSKDNLWRTVVDWAFGPFRAHLDSIGNESADPMDWLRAFICCFIEYSATRPYLAGIATVEGAAHTDRLDYLYDNYINPVSLRFLSVVEQLQRAGRIKPFPPEVLFFLLTSGGTARFGQAGIAARMGIEPNPENPATVRRYAEDVAEILVNGISTGT